VTRSAALGWGRTLPERVISNDDLAGLLDTSPAAILAETGVSVRHWVEPGQGPSDLAVSAAQDALAAAGRAVGEVDMIVFATTTPDIAFPGAGCFLQDKLGCDTVGALDVRAQCAGFPYGLATADRFVRAGKARCVLLATGEVHSTSLERAPHGRGATPWFGDGAAVTVLGPTDGAPGVLATVLHNDPSGYRRFWIEYPASQHYPARMDRPAFEQGRHFPVVDAAALAMDAEARLVEVSREALAAAGTSAEAESFGHVASAGPPMAIVDALADRRIGSGALVLVAAFGAGIAWGGAVLRL
jgi:3-oxoacyl-[acyl-carrier-protein] synthase-3